MGSVKLRQLVIILFFVLLPFNLAFGVDPDEILPDRELEKRAREIFFLGLDYSAQEAFEMGMINKVVTHDKLEETALEWAEMINSKSPTAMRMLKYGFNLPDDGLVGQQLFAGEATRLAYGSSEAREGRDAFNEKRQADFSDYDWCY